MIDLSCVKLPNTPTDGDYLGIEMEFLEMEEPEKRIPGKSEEKAPNIGREPVT